ncbi:MAG: hypothetical protein PUG74_02435, partial [Prevotellaceae bacterium]|nr:hypothetical protein [Prevotellaceae bacterium]
MIIQIENKMKKRTYIIPLTCVLKGTDLMDGFVFFSPNNNGFIDGNEGGALAKPVEIEVEEEEGSETAPTIFRYKPWED